MLLVCCFPPICLRCNPEFLQVLFHLNVTLNSQILGMAEPNCSATVCLSHCAIAVVTSSALALARVRFDHAEFLTSQLRKYQCKHFDHQSSNVVNVRILIDCPTTFDVMFFLLARTILVFGFV